MWSSSARSSTYDDHLDLDCFSNIRSRKTWSSKKQSRISVNSFLWMARYYSLFSEAFPYLWPWSPSFLITYSGIGRKSNVFSMKPRLATVLRDARMCRRRCVPLLFMVRLVQSILKAQRCPRPQSFSWTSYWTGCKVCVVVDRVEDSVDLGGSRSSWPIHEHENFHLASQHVEIQEFGSPCSPRSTLFDRDLIRNGSQRVAPFCHELFRLQR